MLRDMLILILCLLLVMGVQMCSEPNIDNSPYQYPLSKWESTDGSVDFYMGEDKIGYGTITANGETVDVYFTFYDEKEAYCYDIADYWVAHTVEMLEIWDIDCSDKKFVATVYETTYFEVGEEIVFELVEENVDASEIPYPPNPDNIVRDWY